MTKNTFILIGLVFLALIGAVLFFRPELLQMGNSQPAVSVYQPTIEEQQAVQKVQSADSVPEAVDSAVDNIDESLDKVVESDFEQTGINDASLGL